MHPKRKGRGGISVPIGEFEAGIGALEGVYVGGKVRCGLLRNGFGEHQKKEQQGKQQLMPTGFRNRPYTMNTSHAVPWFIVEVDNPLRKEARPSGNFPRPHWPSAPSPVPGYPRC